MLCKCGDTIEQKCSNCSKEVCSSCGQDTVDGFLCGEYTLWGCSRKYTNCDTCCSDIAYHEGDMNYCDECNILECDECFKDHEEHEEELEDVPIEDKSESDDVP